MNFLIKRILPLFIFAGIWAAVIYFVEPPHSWPEASAFQILAFFIPLLLLITFLVDFFFNYLPHAFIAGLGIVMLFVFQAINQLTFITGGIILIVTILCIKLFPRVRLPRFRLTRGTKIPTLHSFEGKKR